MKKIVIDPGHGGADPGACANGLKEKDLNLFVGYRIYENLLNNYENVNVKLTRDTDKDLPPNARIKIVKDFDPVLCVSIHHNSANGEARGAEVIHAYYDKFDDALALSILNRLVRVGMPTRRAFTRLDKQGKDYYYMINKIWDNDTEAIITEGGFLDNPQDVALLRDIKYLNAEAEAIAQSIAEYLELTPKAATEEQKLYIAVSKLQNAGVINSPLYWIENAKAGKTIKGEFVQALILKFDEYMKKW